VYTVFMSVAHRHTSPKIFITSAILTVIISGFVFAYLGLQATLIVATLMIIEITFSFDNAIINAKTLTKMSPLWQRMFMTVGIFIAVFGMRVVFPILIVMATAGLAWGDVIHLALQEPDKYAEALRHAHPSIAAFGGLFLLTLALHFFFDATREIRWLHRIEKPLQEASRRGIHVLVSAIVLAVIVLLPMNHYQTETLTAGAVGIVTYVLIHGISELFTMQHERAEKRAGKKIRSSLAAGLASFI